MKIKITNETEQTDDQVTQHIERRFHFSIGRFESHIHKLSIRLYDINGPRGGEDQRCAMLLKLKLGKEIFLEATAATWETAVDEALARMERSIVRNLEMRRTQRFESGMVPKEL